MLFSPLKNTPSLSEYKKGDILVVFGEVFDKGYVNGLIYEAKKRGMKIIYSTVGRRNAEQVLEPLESSSQKPLINIPLEAGFDLYPDSQGQHLVDKLKSVKLKDWKSTSLDWGSIEESIQMAEKDFIKRVQKWVLELEKEIPSGANVLFVHTMAGGIPRAKILMPLMNQLFKGSGERYLSSKEFWEQTDLGKICEKSFYHVTAKTFQHLINETNSLREKIKKTSYVAYGYHGTEICFNKEYQWQSYAPYLQGFAKKALEDISKEFDCDSCVFNVPEILTNSSSVFLGIEVALYPLISAFQKEAPDHFVTKSILEKSQSLLKEEFSVEDILNTCKEFFESPDFYKEGRDFSIWPQHNNPEQMRLMKEASQKILNMHKNSKELLTELLSEIIFKSCGYIMFHESWNLQNPVHWIGHDLVVKVAIKENGFDLF